MATEDEREPAAELPRHVAGAGPAVAVVEELLGLSVDAVVDLQVHRLRERGREEDLEHEVGSERGGHEALEVATPLLHRGGYATSPVDRHEDHEPDAALLA